MTAGQFTHEADGIINDFTTGISTEKKFKDDILDLWIKVAKPQLELPIDEVSRFEQQVRQGVLSADEICEIEKEIAVLELKVELAKEWAFLDIVYYSQKRIDDLNEKLSKFSA